MTTKAVTNDVHVDPATTKAVTNDVDPVTTKADDDVDPASGDGDVD